MSWSTVIFAPHWSTADLVNNHQPLVSVIALCFNTGGYLVEALQSLHHQTYDHFEVTIVDDASTDDSVPRIKRWLRDHPLPARLMEKEKNEGIPAALNTGIRGSTGSIITWLSDDLWDPDRLELVVKCFAQVPDDVGVVFGDAVMFDDTGSVIGELRPPSTLVAVGVNPQAMLECPPGSWVVLEPTFLREALFHRCFIPAPTAAVRRECYDVVGLYDERLPIEDLDFWFRSAGVTRFAYLRAPLVRYRRHESNFTSGLSSDYLEGLRETLRRYERIFPGHRPTIARHVREEAYRVATGLLAAGYLRKALSTIRRFYLPNLAPTRRCAKETLRLAAAAAGAMISHHVQPPERSQ